MIRKRLVQSSSKHPSFPWALTAVIGQMAQSFVIGLPCTVRVGNETAIAITECQPWRLVNT